MERKLLLEWLQKTGVLQEGHFILSAGKHSSRYLQCALILQHPQYANKLGQAVATLFADMSIDLVVGPALGGVILAYEVARALNCPGIFTERKEGKMELRRGFKIDQGQRVLVVEDVVTTGGSVQEVMEVIRLNGGTPVGVGSLIDRSQNDLGFPCPYRSLLVVEVDLYQPQDCPLCRRGVPLIKPGSREKVD